MYLITLSEYRTLIVGIIRIYFFERALANEHIHSELVKDTHVNSCKEIFAVIGTGSRFNLMSGFREWCAIFHVE